MDARRAPEGIGEGHGSDQLRHLRIDGRSTYSAASGLSVPEGTKALPVPVNRLSLANTRFDSFGHTNARSASLIMASWTAACEAIAGEPSIHG